jgi:hypothetical protein
MRSVKKEDVMILGAKWKWKGGRRNLQNTARERAILRWEEAGHGSRGKRVKIKHATFLGLNFPFLVFNTPFSPRNQWLASTLLPSLTPNVEGSMIMKKKKNPHHYPAPPNE